MNIKTVLAAWSPVTKILVAALAILLIAGGIVLGIVTYDHSFHFEMLGGHHLSVDYGTAFTDPGCQAWYGNHKPLTVNVTGEVDTAVPGEYTLTYHAEYGKSTARATRTVTVVDRVAPELTVPDSVELTQGLSPTADLVAYSAFDEIDGDLTDRVTVTAKRDAIVVSVTDAAGNTATKTVAVLFRPDVEAPVLSLIGRQCYFVRMGNAYTEPGYRATDNVDGDLTDDVSVDGDLNTGKAGSYRLTYRVRDNAGNQTEITRQIVVFDPAVSSGVDGSDHVIYLTFDDGPCCYTDQVLDILAAYGVKATFFVTNQKPAYQNCIGREAREGHTVALHTYSHDYGIYRSSAAFFDDMEAMNEVIKAQTGSYTRLLRFPGGSSNTISRRYATGIMTQLVSEVTDNGYLYFDWNVNSGDASGTAAARNGKTIADNVIHSLGDGRYVVLMHDINAANLTSLPLIIEYGLSHGYTFSPLTEFSPTVHHSVGN